MKAPLLIAAFLVVALWSMERAQADGLVLAVHPYRAATEIISRFTPLAEGLGAALGVPVEISVSDDYTRHIDRIGRAEVDLAYLGPASYVELNRRFGEFAPLARLEINGTPSFYGYVVTRKGAGVRTLEDIAGKRMAFGDPASTMAHLVPRHMLLEAGVDAAAMGGMAHLSTHDDVALGVLMGDFDAGAVKEAVFQKYSRRGLTAVTATPAISEHLFVASRRVPAQWRRAVRDALLGMGERPDGLARLKAIKSTVTNLVPARTTDYRVLTRIIGRLRSEGIVE